MRLGLIGGTDSKRTSGVYQPEDVVALQDAGKYLTRFGYDGVFNALASSGTETSFDISRDGRFVYVVVPGSRTTAVIFQYQCSTPWDLSTITYSSKNLIVGDIEQTLSGIAISDDGTKLYFTGTGSDTIFSCVLSTPYDLATAIIDIGKVYIGTQATSNYSLFFGDSGTKMYLNNYSTSTVFQYTLSTAWNVNTATYASKSLVVSAVDTGPYGLFFRDNGTRLFITGDTNDIVFSYTLSTAWDITTGTADYSLKSFSVATQVAAGTFENVFIGDNGTKMYALSGGTATTDTIYQYTLSTAWDISTASYATKSFSVNAQEPTTFGMYFKDDGTALYIVGQTNDTVYQYTLSTAWDIATASYASKSKAVGTEETAPTGLFLGDSGTKMYVIGSTGDDVNQYSLSTAWDVSTATFVRVSAAVGDTVPQDVFFRNNGTRMYVIGSTNDAVREFTLSTAWDVSTITFSRSYPIGYLDALPSGIAFKSDGTEMYFSGNTNRVVYQLSLATAWSSGSVKGRFWLGNEEISASGLFFKPDGLKMYVCGSTGDDVNEYDLSTAWDIATATFLRVSATIGDTTPYAVWFKDDGTKMYVLGDGANSIREFTLSTAWNVSTITFSKATVFPFASVPTGFAFKDDGTAVYINDFNLKVVFSIPLSTAWDIGTVKGFLNVGAVETTPRGLSINNDGTLMYLSGTSTIRKYVLSTPYDITTATSSQTFTLANVYGIHVSANGLRINAGTTSPGPGTTGGRNIVQITMTSPNDLTTATLNPTNETIGLFGITGIATIVYGVRVSPDGTRLLALSDVTSGLYQFSLRFA
jgi:sugar lactone lactonase YvrE